MAIDTHFICPNPDCHKSMPQSANYCPYCGYDAILNNETQHPYDNRHYRLTRIIKHGGQGSVYEGIDQHGRRYAIKEMLDSFTRTEELDEAIERFNAEANLLQNLSHPRIPRVYSHFTDGGRHYLTMDFVKGKDLEQIVEQQGALPESQVLEWAMQICDVLDFLHKNGYVYRDMKPSNVMLDATDGTIKLVDFGIAKVFQTTTPQGSQIGTPGYAPPEQYQGIATPASDIYALGATLHYLLTGRDPTEHAPFSFEPPRNINRHISRRTSDAITKALTMDAPARFDTVAEFRAMLRPVSTSRLDQILVAAARPNTPGVAYPQVAASAPVMRQNTSPQSPNPLIQPDLPTTPSGAKPFAIPIPPSQPPAIRPSKAPSAVPPATNSQPRQQVRRARGFVVQMIGMILILIGLLVLIWFLVSGQFGISPFVETSQVPAAALAALPTHEGISMFGLMWRLCRHIKPNIR